MARESVTFNHWPVCMCVCVRAHARVCSFTPSAHSFDPGIHGPQEYGDLRLHNLADKVRQHPGGRAPVLGLLKLTESQGLKGLGQPADS